MEMAISPLSPAIFYPQKMTFVGKILSFIKNSLLKKLPCIAQYLATYYLCPMKDNRRETLRHRKAKQS